MKIKKVILGKYTPFRYFEILQPRWHDRKVLLAAFKIGAHNKIVFTKAPTMGVEPYYISGAVAKKFKKESNGKIDCYAVPIDELTPLEIEQNDMRALL